jgi:hypothetical protein
VIHDAGMVNGEAYDHLDVWGTCMCSCRVCRDPAGICVCRACIECNGDDADNG